MGNKVAVMGDLVLTEGEVSPLMKKLTEERIEILRCTIISSAPGQ